MSTDAYMDGDCLVTPARPYIAPTPARVEREVVRAWNAGANSIKQLDGNFRTQFSMPAGVGGVAIGFKGSRSKQVIPDLIEHGLYFQSLGSFDAAQVIERGAIQSLAQPSAPTDVWEIRRALGRVSYWKNGVRFYASSTPSAGPKLVNACLYGSGDAVGAQDKDAPPPPSLEVVQTNSHGGGVIGFALPASVTRAELQGVELRHDPANYNGCGGSSVDWPLYGIGGSAALTLDAGAEGGPVFWSTLQNGDVAAFVSHDPDASIGSWFGTFTVVDSDTGKTYVGTGGYTSCE